MRAGAVTAWLGVAAGAWFGDLILPALRPDEGAGRNAVTAGLWLAYAVVLAALLLPGGRPLTVVRIGVPAGALELVASLGHTLEGSLHPFTVVGLVAALAAVNVVLQPGYAEAQVDAGSYGDERRFLLRPPGPILIALVLPVWAVSVAGTTAGPLLLAHRRWTAGSGDYRRRAARRGPWGPHPVPAGAALGWCSCPTGWWSTTIWPWPSRCL